LPSHSSVEANFHYYAMDFHYVLSPCPFSHCSVSIELTIDQGGTPEARSMADKIHYWRRCQSWPQHENVYILIL
ncbi:unnamed protein product, partial [Musa acuminata subsp. burmannicoides]